jgi:hypothetical protein
MTDGVLLVGIWATKRQEIEFLMPGIPLLVAVSVLRFLARHFAGPLVQKLSSIGLLCFSCLVGSLGLVALSVANYSVYGNHGGDTVERWRVLHGADHARHGIGTISARRRVTDGLMDTAGTLSISSSFQWWAPSTIRRNWRLRGATLHLKPSARDLNWVECRAQRRKCPSAMLLFSRRYW